MPADGWAIASQTGQDKWKPKDKSLAYREVAAPRYENGAYELAEIETLIRATMLQKEVQEIRVVLPVEIAKCRDQLIGTLSRLSPFLDIEEAPEGFADRATAFDKQGSHAAQ